MALVPTIIRADSMIWNICGDAVVDVAEQVADGRAVRPPKRQLAGGRDLRPILCSTLVT